MTMVAASEATWAMALVFRGHAAPPLHALREDALKQAFRRRARDTHPDRAVLRGCSEAILAKDFRDLRNAYEVLLSWLTQKPAHRLPPRAQTRPAPKTTRPPRPARPQARAQTRPPPRSPPPHRPPPPPQAERPRARPAPEAASSFATSPPAHCDVGLLPRRSVLFAEFLHLSGLINWQQRIAAIVWQRKQRPPIGQLAQSWGYLQDWQVEALIRNRRLGERFGEAAVRLGWISAFQCQVLLGGQRRSQQPIGAYFLAEGIVSAVVLERALVVFSDHNRRYALRA